MALTGREMRPCWPRKVAVCIIEEDNQLYDREKEEKIKELKEEYQKALEKQ